MQKLLSTRIMWPIVTVFILNMLPCSQSSPSCSPSPLMALLPLGTKESRGNGSEVSVHFLITFLALNPATLDEVDNGCIKRQAVCCGF